MPFSTFFKQHFVEQLKKKLFEATDEYYEKKEQQIIRENILAQNAIWGSYFLFRGKKYTLPYLAELHQISLHPSLRKEFIELVDEKDDYEIKKEEILHIITLALNHAKEYQDILLLLPGSIQQFFPPVSNTDSVTTYTEQEIADFLEKHKDKYDKLHTYIVSTYLLKLHNQSK
jgi:hypothetical protein